jgi:DHA2 family multidrug resistance protein
MGFMMLMAFGFMMSRADINATKMFFALPLLIRGGGLAMLMVPLTTQAVQGLKPADMSQGIALNNMMRQLGGSFGIAIINNYIAQRYAVHRMDFVSNIYQGSLQLTERIAAMTQGIQSKLAVTGNVQGQVNRILDLAVTKQAYLVTYLDAFLFSAICVLIAFPLILFTGSGKPKLKSGARAEQG